MNGKNKGKKYIKLKGNEIARPQDEARAQRFLRWYGKNCSNLHKFVRNFDADTAHDVALHVYNRMAYTGLKPQDNTAYYLMAYRNALVVKAKQQTRYVETHIYLDELPVDVPEYHIDALEYEERFAEFEEEVLEYVRNNYDELSVSLFEIYVALQPHTSYKKLSAMLGIQWSKVWPMISAIRKDVAQRYGGRRKNLVSRD